jgi:SAM-dependent methyltransferase
VTERERLRATFDEVPELYDRARPTYPPELFEDLAPHLGQRVLEIGPGTGQATRALAGRGYDVVAVELGARLADVARRNLGDCPNVEIVTADVERWEPPHPFDAVVAFTAFHWLDAATRYVTAHRLLRERGTLAIAETHHVLRSGGDAFWRDVQEDYAAIGQHDDPPPCPDGIADLRDEIDASGRFRTTATHRYLWDVVYDADSYIAVLETYSGHRALDDATRADLYARIRTRIGPRTIAKTYLAILNVARATP